MTRNPGAATLPEAVDVPLMPAVVPSAHRTAVVGAIDTGVVSLGGPHERISACLDRLSLIEENLDTLSGDAVNRIDGHGTFVVGRIVQETPDVTVLSRRALGDVPSAGDDGLVAARLEEFAALVPELRPQVVNLSFFGEEQEPPPGIGRALLDLLDAAPEVVVVTAAGNRWSDVPPWPAAFARDLQRHRDRIVVVGAVDTSILPVDDLKPPRASFSNRWSAIRLWAPGVRVAGPHVRHTGDGWVFGTALWSGTSFAAATVTGVLARGVAAGKSAPEVLAGLLAAGEIVPAADTCWPGL